jgi:hypothetical protein
MVPQFEVSSRGVPLSSWNSSLYVTNALQYTNYHPLCKLPPPHIPRLNRPRLLTPHPRINLIHSIERQVQELMLIIPPDVLLLKLLQFLGRRRRLRDLRNKVSRRRFGDSVDQDAQERDFQEEEESDGEAVEHAAAVVEPEFLLLGGVADAGEVGVQLGGWLGAGFFVV